MLISSSIFLFWDSMRDMIHSLKKTTKKTLIYLKLPVVQPPQHLRETSPIRSRLLERTFSSDWTEDISPPRPLTGDEEALKVNC